MEISQDQEHRRDEVGAILDPPSNNSLIGTVGQRGLDASVGLAGLPRAPRTERAVRGPGADHDPEIAVVTPPAPWAPRRIQTAVSPLANFSRRLNCSNAV